MRKHSWKFLFPGSKKGGKIKLVSRNIRYLLRQEVPARAFKKINFVNFIIFLNYIKVTHRSILLMSKVLYSICHKNIIADVCIQLILASCHPGYEKFRRARNNQSVPHPLAVNKHRESFVTDNAAVTRLPFSPLFFPPASCPSTVGNGPRAERCCDPISPIICVVRNSLSTPNFAEELNSVVTVRRMSFGRWKFFSKQIAFRSRCLIF
ncbi:hypothetical protein PUN28_005269 [Cardiocondyla obscurior]|uniref:Uncharacterized protein n=1 Tax=Cardiocondyla obscurior TaxID=286306 RepID=A0AAW2GF05_9HYME